jgi:hypothetical protein
VILIQDFEKLILCNLVSNTCGLLELAVFLTESLIESWHLYLVIIHEGLLLLKDNLIELANKVLLAAIHCLLTLVEYLTH